MTEIGTPLTTEQAGWLATARAHVHCEDAQFRAAHVTLVAHPVVEPATFCLVIGDARLGPDAPRGTS